MQNVIASRDKGYLSLLKNKGYVRVDASHHATKHNYTEDCRNSGGIGLTSYGLIPED